MKMARTCKQCGCQIPSYTASTTFPHKKKFCGIDCMTKWGLQEVERKKTEEREKNEAWQREFKEKTSTPTKAKEHIRSRTEWFSILQDLFNQYALNVFYAKEPCSTCGASRHSRKFDCGHYRSRGACKELAFEITNVSPQCVICNQHGSGMRVEYREYIVNRYGKEHLDWLDGPHPSLKEQFPDNDSIKAQCKKYRKLITEAGLKPRR